MKRLLPLLLVTPLSGCFFVFIPPGLIDKVAGNPAYCVRSSAKVGETFEMAGNRYEITRVAGESPYICRNQPEGMKMGVDAKIIGAVNYPSPPKY